MATEHVPSTDPRCQAIQDGYNNYGYGLLLSPDKWTVVYDRDGSGRQQWLISYPDGDREDFTDKWANVHFIPGADGYPKRHEGRWVYGVRFWAAACAKCAGPCEHDETCAKCAITEANPDNPHA